MHAGLLERLQHGLAEAESRHLRRHLRPLAGTGREVCDDGRPLLNLAGNDYLALSQHPALRRAAAEAAETQGVGSGASRLVTGHLQQHAAFEARFAAFKRPASPAAALLMPTGFTANLCALTALAGPGDTIFQDKLNHASLIDAAAISGATVRTYPHNDLAALRRRLEREPRAGQAATGLRFLVTDSVFSMDGDCADLPGLCELAERFDAVLVVDEAHATGVLGPRGAGLADLAGVSDRIDISVSTASKALGGLGGIVTAHPTVIAGIVQQARPFIYSTAVPPPQIAAIDAALNVVAAEPWRRQRLQELAEHLRGALAGQGWTLPPTSVATPIVPLLTGSAEAALALAEALQSAGILAVGIRPPTVPRGAARVRLSLRCDLQDADLERLLAALHPYRPH